MCQKFYFNSTQKFFQNRRWIRKTRDALYKVKPVTKFFFSSIFSNIFLQNFTKKQPIVEASIQRQERMKRIFQKKKFWQLFMMRQLISGTGVGRSSSKSLTFEHPRSSLSTFPPTRLCGLLVLVPRDTLKWECNFQHL